jgi:hypothetical protein
MDTTRVRRTTVLALVIAATAITGALTPGEARADDGWTTTSTREYIVGDVGPLGNTIGHVVQSRCGFGTLCFGRTVGDTFTVTVDDDSGRAVGGVIHLTGRGGWRVLSRTFCGTSGPVPALPGELTVYLDAPGDVRGAHWFGGPGCTEINPLGGTIGATTAGATSGRVTVTYSRAG